MDRLRAALLFWLLLAASASAQVCGTVSGCPTASTPFNGTELIYTVQGGVSKQTTIGAILDQAAAITSPLIVGTTPIQGTTGGYLLFANGPLLGAEPAASLSIATSQLTGVLRAAQFPALTGDVTTVAGALATTISAGAVTNAKLANASTTVNGQTCTLGSTCTITATAATITVGTTVIMAGTSGDIEFNNAGVLGEKGVTGTGNVVLASSPTLVTPALGTPSALTLTNATGLPIAGITGLGTGVGTALAASVTGSGGIVLATAPSISGLTVTGSFAATGLVTNADLANSSLTIGSTNIALGGTQTTLAGLTSVTSTTFVGSLTGHASLDCALAGCTITGATSIAGLTVTGSLTATGLVTNADLANASTTVNGVVCTLGSTCTITASAGTITIGSTTIASGTTGFLLYNNGGTLGNETIVSILTAGAGFSIAGTTNATLSPTAITRPGGRLTLQSHTPVMTTTQSGKTSVLYDSYATGYVPYYNGTTDLLDAIASNEMTLTLESSGTGVTNANGVFDIWWWHNNGAPVLCAATNGSGGGWASDTGGSNTARGTGYSQLDQSTRAYITNKNSIAHCYNGTTDYGTISANQATYLGTVCTDAATAGSVSYTFGGNASGGTAGRFCVWNYYNRVTAVTSVVDTGTAYTYTSSTTRQARASTGNQITFVVGVQEDGVLASYTSEIDTTAIVNASGSVGIGLDSTTIVDSPRGLVFAESAASLIARGITFFGGTAGVGLHFLAALESGDNANANTFDHFSDATLQVTLRQ